MKHDINNAHIRSIAIASGPMIQHVNAHAQTSPTLTYIYFQTPEDCQAFQTELDARAETDLRIIPAARMEDFGISDAKPTRLKIENLARKDVANRQRENGYCLQLFDFGNTGAAFDLLVEKNWLDPQQRTALEQDLHRACLTSNMAIGYTAWAPIQRATEYLADELGKDSKTGALTRYLREPGTNEPNR